MNGDDWRVKVKGNFESAVRPMRPTLAGIIGGPFIKNKEDHNRKKLI